MSTCPLELPVQPANQPLTRAADDVHAMAVAVQANLVQLRVSAARRCGGASLAFDQPVVSPGAVRSFRETLIDRGVLKGYSDGEVLLRMHEVWGQFCLMRWACKLDTRDDRAVDFATQSEPLELRCDSALSVKMAEITGVFWRIRFEQRCRDDAGYAASASFTDDRALADKITAVAFGKPVADASDEALLCAACESTGMVSTLRWIMDRRRMWGEAGLGEISDRPF